jgi:hypothetical protein
MWAVQVAAKDSVDEIVCGLALPLDVHVHVDAVL